MSKYTFSTEISNINQIKDQLPEYIEYNHIRLVIAILVGQYGQRREIGEGEIYLEGSQGDLNTSPQQARLELEVRTVSVNRGGKQDEEMYLEGSQSGLNTSPQQAKLKLEERTFSMDREEKQGMENSTWREVSGTLVLPLNKHG
ncbi:hypothetical protein DPMN_086212 [Dreissena polymorpha]|uniref:Uncharacterized protein n=1 Tax=Dreissena polymorpha TaxID=45954 RepID=A0A9D3YH51_DREPO|nr:hypothetical protein DPMN_086212 [Dreissena polymorpha]